MQNKMVLILCFLGFLLFCSTVHAESWVLWTKIEYSKTDLSHDIFWEIMGGYPDYNTCLQVKDKIYRVRQKEAREDKKQYPSISKLDEVPTELIIITFKDPKEIYSKSISFFCLPGTLDPREKK